MTVFRPLLAAAVLLFAALPPSAFAAQPPAQITVGGDGSASAMPDMATVSFSLATYADAAQPATSQNNAIYDKLVSALAALGIAKSDVRTTSYNLNYNPPPSPQPGQTSVQPPPDQRYGYSVNRGISVALHNTALVGKTIDAAVNAGVSNVNGVDFGVSDRKGQMARALRAAVADARAKAQAIAAAAGVHIVRVSDISEGGSSAPRPMYRLNAAAAQAPAPTQIEPSAVEVQASVTVTFDVAP